ncbi:unnamed protein product [Moneuplotes crassus]|uniref:RING-type domain-containing protein n=1 Tax=Euplotes crassus TaxID=5936 RepID=A0AAD2CVI0_EUPCR|nr:unnamed protein product [Moneuplotes crassus]
MEEREPKVLDKGEEERREGGFDKEGGRKDAICEEEKQRTGCHSAQGCMRGCPRGEEDEEDYDCSICITSFDEINTKAIPLLKKKLKSFQIEQISIVDSEPSGSSSSEDIAILYFYHLDSKMNWPSNIPKDIVRVVRQRDIEDNLEEILTNFETNGVSILFNCSHIFHKCCIRDWIKEHNTCPVCRKKIYQKENEDQYFEEPDYDNNQIDLVRDIDDGSRDYGFSYSHSSHSDDFSNLSDNEDEPIGDVLNIALHQLNNSDHLITTENEYDNSHNEGILANYPYCDSPLPSQRNSSESSFPFTF